MSKPKEQIEEEIAVSARRSLVHALMEHDPVNELWLHVLPVALGALSPNAMVITQWARA